MSRKARTLFFIDGSHYDRLRSTLETPFHLGRLAAYANEGTPADQKIYYRDLRDAKEEGRQKPLLGWLVRNGFVLKGRIHRLEEHRERYGTNLVQIAVDALQMADPGDHVMIMAGDAKLQPLLAALRDYDIKTTLISALDAPKAIAPPSILIEAASNFIDVRSIISQLRLDKIRGEGSV